MCISSGPSYAAPVAKDTSKEPIKSMYELTPEQIEENKRRRRMNRKPKSLLTGDGDNGMGAGTSVGGGGYGSVGDASGGMAQV
jgi:hypothetical protein